MAGARAGLKLALQRLAVVPFGALLVSAAVFAGVHVKTGDPCQRERNVSPLIHARCMHALGLDRPLYQQYGDWLGQITRGIVSPTLAGEAATSAWLGSWALLVAVGLGVAGGAVAAARHGSLLDGGLNGAFTVLMSLPVFVMASALILLTVTGFYGWSGGLIYERIGWGSPDQIPVPALALGLTPAALIARHVRASLLDTLGQEYVRTARAKGLTERSVVLRHALRNSLIPVASLLGPIATNVITGSVLVEYMFGIPGLGKDLVHGLLGYNYLLPVTIMTYYALLIGVANSLTEVVYTLLDPRIGGR